MRQWWTYRGGRRTGPTQNVAQLATVVGIAALTMGHAIGTRCVAQVPKPAAGEDLNAQWETAVNYFKYQDFDKAVERLVALLYPVNRLEPKRELKAREYLGASYWWQGKREAAFDEFTALLVRAPHTKLEPAQYPPKMIDDFEQRRKRLVDTGVIKGDAVAEPEPPSANREGAAPLAMVLFPFGVGQFANHEPTKGWLFLGTEALFGGVSVGYYLRNRDLGRVGPRPLSTDIAQISTGAVFWAIALWGIWDAWSTQTATSADRPPAARPAL